MVEKTDLIIDGNALYYFLYYTSDPKLDQRCGGDYPGFKHEVCKFFKTLQDCEVNPYVILDGEEDGKIPAKIYTHSKFCEHFKLDPALMPVFASIAGNDYSNLEDNDIFANKSSSPGDKITEYDRNGENIKHYHVRPIPPSSHEQKQLKLQCLTEYLSMQDERRRVFEEALEVQTSVLENIPNQLKLPVYVTVFWFKSLQQHHCLHALLLWFVCKPDGPEDEFERKMKVLNDEGVSNWKPCVAHAFSQWQCCMRQSLHLNQLLLSPLPEPQFAR
ncbi:protein asteroid homolog 1-like [Pundamilia nyererei]|uniref:Protein asteroid homolog 1-like n=1 Tax=Pundamilia nyererei TaxID=303518 RepID=A0A9Y6MAZ1_9CICH|nr:PREDICTED: protein asteroid homolog 1-like [Pundamilia nyererei]